MRQLLVIGVLALVACSEDEPTRNDLRGVWHGEADGWEIVLKLDSMEVLDANGAMFRTFWGEVDVDGFVTDAYATYTGGERDDTGETWDDEVSFEYFHEETDTTLIGQFEGNLVSATEMTGQIERSDANWEVIPLTLRRD